MEHKLVIVLCFYLAIGAKAGAKHGENIASRALYGSVNKTIQVCVHIYCINCFLLSRILGMLIWIGVIGIQIPILAQINIPGAIPKHLHINPIVKYKFARWLTDDNVNLNNTD